MKLPPKAHAPELHEGGEVFYYEKPVKWGDLEQKSKKVQLPLWLVDLINRECQKRYWDGYNEYRKQLQTLIGVQQ